MVRLSASNYNTLPVELRDKAKNRLLAYAARSKIAVARYKNDRSLIGFMWKKLDTTERKALTEIFKSGGVSINESKSGITMEQDEKPAGIVTEAVAAVEAADKNVNTVVSKVAAGVVATGRAVATVAGGSYRAAGWVYNRTLIGKLTIAGLSTLLYVQFMQQYTGGNVPETLRKIMIDGVTVGGYTVAAGTIAICFEAMMSHIYEFSKVWNRRISEQQLSDALEKEKADRKADHEKYLRETKDTKDEQIRNNREYEAKIAQLEHDKRALETRVSSSQERLNHMLYEGHLHAQQANSNLMSQNDRYLRVAEHRVFGHNEPALAITGPAMVAPEAQKPQPKPASKPVPKQEAKSSVKRQLTAEEEYDEHIANLTRALGE